MQSLPKIISFPLSLCLSLLLASTHMFSLKKQKEGEKEKERERKKRKRMQHQLLPELSVEFCLLVYCTNFGVAISTIA